jgi:hypothetical protein
MMPKRTGKCAECGIDFSKRKHTAKGLCVNCYTRPKQLKYIEKQMEKDPAWNAKRQKRFRETHPDSYNRGQASYFLRKMTKKDRDRLLLGLGYAPIQSEKEVKKCH